MKIIATSDLHGNLEGLDFTGCDIAVIAGDFADLRGGGKWHWYDQKKWIQKKFIPFTEKFPKTQFCVIPGNHDMVLDPGKTFLHPDLDFRISYPENVHILIDNSVTINGVKIYGTPWVPIINYRWAFEADHETLVKKFSSIPESTDILITHTPPHIDSQCYIDRSIQWGADDAFGSTELADEIAEKQPKYVFCGHIHSGLHNPVKFLDSTIYNVSRVDENYEIAYEPVVIDYES